MFAARLLPALRARGHDVTVMTDRPPSDLPAVDQFQGIPVHRFPFWTAAAHREMDALMAVRQQVITLKRELAPDLIHINNGLANFFHAVTTRTHATPTLLAVNEFVPDRTCRPDSLAENTLRAADWVVGCSGDVLARVRALVPEISPRSSCIYYGHEVPKLPPEPLSFEAPRLLCLGRFEPQKGYDLALSAFASVADRVPGARLVLAGEGTTRAELEQQVSESGFGRAVDFVDWLPPDQVLPTINAVTMVLVPSRQEGFGLVALEAALMARPVVATRVGGLPEVVVHGQTGLLVEPENSEALAEAIVYLLGHPDTAIRMGQAARERAQEVFGWERCVDAYDALYRQLVAE